MTNIEIKKEVEKIANNNLKSFIKSIPTFSNNDILNDLYFTYCIEKSNNNVPCVYFIKNKYTGLIKIGRTKDINQRISQLNSIFISHFGVNDALELIGIICTFNGNEHKLETLIHKNYKNVRQYGEWFKLSKETVINDYLFGDVIINDIRVNIDSDDLIKNEYDFDFQKSIDSANLSNWFIKKTISNIDDIGLQKYLLDLFGFDILIGDSSQDFDKLLNFTEWLNLKNKSINSYKTAIEHVVKNLNID